MTSQRRLVLQPMEQLYCQNYNSFALDNERGRLYKPGLYDQTMAFLAGAPDDRLLDISHHSRLFSPYIALRDGRSFSHL